MNVEKEIDRPVPILRTLFLYTLWLCFLVSVSLLSYHLRNFTNSLLLFLPIALSIVLVQWYGYRFLPVIFINGIITLLIWHAHGSWAYLLLIATHEPLVAFLSKLLVSKVQRKTLRECFGNANQFTLFIALGIFIPVASNSLYTYHYSFIDGNMEKVGLLFLSDFMTVFSLSIPLLYFFQPKASVSITVTEEFNQLHFTKRKHAEFWIMVTIFIIISFMIPFGQYWFVYGIAAVVIGVRQGFESVLLINCIVFFINYLLPLIEASTALTTSSGSTQLINVHLGNATMLFVSSLVGRVVSDLKITEKTLIQQKQVIEKANEQLHQSNKELDRFVYSVSHDLSAPLKSIQGLIHLSRMDTSSDAASLYLNMMEKSAGRLEIFINEVLDFSRTTRKEAECKPVHLTELIHELKERFVVYDVNRSIEVKLALQYDQIATDPLLLKMALGNLFSNAIKFQNKYAGHIPTLEIRSSQTGNEFHIDVIDNGDGIEELHLKKIFDMFYRATSKSPGSGLGLYIAREAISKLGGSIRVKTKYGEGSTFTIVLPAPSGHQLSSLK